MNCEICGNRILGKPTQISIERSILTVCQDCVRFGVTVDRRTAAKIEMSSPRLGARRLPPTKPPRKDQFGEFVLIDNFGAIIRKARESAGMTREVFAARLGEKDSVIRRVESGEMYPTAELTSKIERLLKIKLKATVDASAKGSTPSPSNLTLGDVAVLREGRTS